MILCLSNCCPFPRYAQLLKKTQELQQHHCNRNQGNTGVIPTHPPTYTGMTNNNIVLTAIFFLHVCPINSRTSTALCGWLLVHQKTAGWMDGWCRGQQGTGRACIIHPSVGQSGETLHMHTKWNIIFVPQHQRRTQHSTGSAFLFYIPKLRWGY